MPAMVSLYAAQCHFRSCVPAGKMWKPCRWCSRLATVCCGRTWTLPG